MSEKSPILKLLPSRKCVTTPERNVAQPEFLRQEGGVLAAGKGQYMCHFLLSFSFLGGGEGEGGKYLVGHKPICPNRYNVPALTCIFMVAEVS